MTKLILAAFFTISACGNVREEDTTPNLNTIPDMTTASKSDMTTVEKPAWRCTDETRLDPSKTIERTMGQIMLGEHEMFYDCKLSTYCVRAYDTTNTNLVCWPYFQPSDWSSINTYVSNKLDDQLIQMYTSGSYTTNDGITYTPQKVTPWIGNPSHLQRGFDNSKAVIPILYKF